MSNLLLPPASGDLTLNITIPSGYVGYVQLAHNTIVPSGVLIEAFLVKEIVERSIICFEQTIVQNDYKNTIASGVKIENNHGNFVSNIDSERVIMINQLKADLGYGV